MAHEGHIIIKGKGKPVDYRDFFGHMDRNRDGKIISNRPTFSYPTRIAELSEEVKSLEKALDGNFVSSDRRMEVELRHKALKKKLDGVKTDEADAQKLYNENKDAVWARFKELKETITNGMPTKEDSRKGRVSPHKVLREEKAGFGELKKEYMVLARILGEPTDTTLLQREGGVPYQPIPYAMPESARQEPEPVVVQEGNSMGKTPIEPKKKAAPKRKPARKKPVAKKPAPAVSEAPKE